MLKEHFDRISIFGLPGTGKSTVGSCIFAELTRNGIPSEIVDFDPGAFDAIGKDTRLEHIEKDGIAVYVDTLPIEQLNKAPFPPLQERMLSIRCLGGRKFVIGHTEIGEPLELHGDWQDILPAVQSSLESTILTKKQQTPKNETERRTM